jgi:perosamine synthetase
MMLMFTPNPKNRLYNSFDSYLLFLRYLLTGRFQQNRQDIVEFEKTLADRFNTNHAIAVYQCRLGIYLAVKALIKPGQEVILSPYTIVDVINMVIFAGGRPVFADVEHQTCNVSVAEVERLINSNTGAVLITHLHGLAANAHSIKAVCDKFHISLIEDAAQSFGVEEEGKAVGTIGDAGVFSFEMHKNMPTWLGGAVLSNRSDIVEKIRAELQDFSHPSLPGIAQKVKKGIVHDIASLPLLFQLLTYPIIRFGYLNNLEFINKRVRRQPQESAPAATLPEIYKSQYTTLQAQLGLSQLDKVDRHIQNRIEYAHIYYEGLKDIEQLVLPPLRNDKSHTYLWFPILYIRRAELLQFMYEQGRDIAAGHFTSTAEAPQFAEFYRHCPNAKKVEEELIYLPTYPSYSRREVEKNIEVIKRFFASQKTTLQNPEESQVETAVSAYSQT